MGSATALPVLRPEEPAVEPTVYDRDACHQQSPGDQAGVSYWVGMLHRATW